MKSSQKSEKKKSPFARSKLSTAERQKLTQEMENFFYSILMNEVNIKWTKTKYTTPTAHVMLVCSLFESTSQLDRIDWVKQKIKQSSGRWASLISYIGCMSVSEAED